MIRALLVALGGLIVVLAGFAAVFFIWHYENAARAASLGVPYTTFNWETAFVQQRGCNSCHGDHLAEDLSRLVVSRTKPKLHGIFKMSYGIPMRVEDCLPCHDLTTSLPFAEQIHSLHLQSVGFADMGGNCASCHILEHGIFALYDDETRYSVMNGVVGIPTPAFSPAR